MKYLELVFANIFPRKMIIEARGSIFFLGIISPKENLEALLISFLFYFAIILLFCYFILDRVKVKVELLTQKEMLVGSKIIL